MKDTHALKNILQRFDNARVLVIGDLILDQYIWGSVERVSPEAPVPVVWAKRRTYVPGGAANVANNIASLGGKASLLGVVGDDLQARTFMTELKARSIATSGVFVEKGRQTIMKTRIIAGHQQVVRVDWEDADPIKGETRNKLQDFIQKKIKEFDAVIIEDYGKGLLDDFLLHVITNESRSQGKIVTVDPKEDNFEYYRGATCITPNRKEAQNAIRYLKMKDTRGEFQIYKDSLVLNSDIDKAGKAILDYLQLEGLLITLGEQGMCLFEVGKKPLYIPTVAQEVFDVSGAGDTVIAAFTLCLAAGAAKKDAAYLANFAAGIVVGKLGTATTSRKELAERL
jgi:D-glycero-beta-D-manno-heptose-7-phosphate kinase